LGDVSEPFPAVERVFLQVRWTDGTVREVEAESPWDLGLVVVPSGTDFGFPLGPASTGAEFLPPMEVAVTLAFKGNPRHPVIIRIAETDGPLRLERLRELARLEDWLHSRHLHPDYEYETTKGQRKAWDRQDTPPDGDGWERNVTGDDPEGWERFEYHEESYWRRRLMPADADFCPSRGQ
jgi:hypothetical protein